MYTIIIPTRTIGNLVACYEAIRRCERPMPRVIVVDDGLRSRMVGPDYVAGAKPFVFARNANIGITAAGDDDVILLNDDALLQTRGGFSSLMRQAEANPTLGIISAVTNLTGNPAQHPRGIGLRREPKMVCFVCVYIPRRVLDTVGLLDERFGPKVDTGHGAVGYGCEDDDYSRRVLDAGLQIGIYDHCYVDHGTLKSTFRGNPKRPVDLEAHRRIFQEKWGVRP